MSAERESVVGPDEDLEVYRGGSFEPLPVERPVAPTVSRVDEICAAASQQGLTGEQAEALIQGGM